MMKLLSQFLVALCLLCQAAAFVKPEVKAKVPATSTTELNMYRSGWGRNPYDMNYGRYGYGYNDYGPSAYRNGYRNVYNDRYGGGGYYNNGYGGGGGYGGYG